LLKINDYSLLDQLKLASFVVLLQTTRLVDAHPLENTKDNSLGHQPACDLHPDIYIVQDGNFFCIQAK
jgi:hypothetical protein